MLHCGVNVSDNQCNLHGTRSQGQTGNQGLTGSEGTGTRGTVKLLFGSRTGISENPKIVNQTAAALASEREWRSDTLAGRARDGK